MPQTRLPTAAELAILQILWEKGPLGVRAVLGHLTRERDVGYTTVLKQIQIMTGKGLVVKDDTVRPQIYRPASPRHQTQRGLVRRLADGAFDGSAGDLALYALKTKSITAEDRARIRTLLDEMEEGE